MFMPILDVDGIVVGTVAPRLAKPAFCPLANICAERLIEIVPFLARWPVRLLLGW
jgi:hypothetical protein